jgi:putative nucleotide binding protein
MEEEMPTDRKEEVTEAPVGRKEEVTEAPVGRKEEVTEAPVGGKEEKTEAPIDRKEERREEKIREEQAIVLDYLPEGITSLPVYKRYPVAQTVGTRFFVLLEVTPKQGVNFHAHEEVYVGDGERDKVRTIKKRLRYSELTSTAKSELPDVVAEAVKKNEKAFIEFFNRATAISLKHHQLELLPKIGKKHLYKILEERDIKKFESFKDIDERVRGLPSTEKLVAERVLQEIEDPEVEHRLFVPDFGKDEHR